MLQAPCKLQVLLGYSSISAAVESLHSTHVLPMGAEVPLAVFCATRAIPCSKNSAGSLSSRLKDQEEGCSPVVKPRGASMADEYWRSQAVGVGVQSMSVTCPLAALSLMRLIGVTQGHLLGR